MTEKTDPGLLELCTRPAVMRRAASIALVVGTLLAIINHGDRLLSGEITTEVVTKILLTYLVPYSVSTYSAVLTIRERLREA